MSSIVVPGSEDEEDSAEHPPRIPEQDVPARRGVAESRRGADRSGHHHPVLNPTGGASSDRSIDTHRLPVPLGRQG